MKKKNKAKQERQREHTIKRSQTNRTNTKCFVHKEDEQTKDRNQLCRRDFNFVHFTYLQPPSLNPFHQFFLDPHPPILSCYSVTYFFVAYFFFRRFCCHSSQFTFYMCFIIFLVDFVIAFRLVWLMEMHIDRVEWMLERKRAKCMDNDLPHRDIVLRFFIITIIKYAPSFLICLPLPLPSPSPSHIPLAVHTAGRDLFMPPIH